jgi:hypothetical protein
MKAKAVILLMTLLGALQVKAQLNEYKYIIIPKTLAEFNKPNKYQTSTLLKHLFTTNGFTAVYEDQMPEELVDNRCMGLKADLDDSSNLFTIKGALVLKDCRDQEVFRGAEGKTKEKDFKLGYREVIQESFATIMALNYTYEPTNAKQAKEGKNPPTLNFKGDVKNFSGEAVATTAAATPTVANAVGSEKAVLEKHQAPMAKQKATLEEQSYEQPLKEAGELKNVPTQVAEVKLAGKTLYAQPIEGGYQLVDNTPKIVCKLTETSLPDVYLAQGEGVSGMVRKVDGQWVMEYQKDGKTHKEVMKIKF